MKNRKWWYIGGAALLALILLGALALRPGGGGSGSYDNLIRNGDFESLRDGLPQDWDTSAYFQQLSYTDYSVTENGVTGSAAHIVNNRANDARFFQTVSVSPNTLYCLHGFIKAHAEGGLGANLSIEGVYVFSETVYDTGDDWQEVTLYGRTGAKQRSVTVYARLGGYSGEATGEAWFDDITLNRVDSVPSGYVETLWMDIEEEAPSAASGTGAWQLLLGSAAYAGLFLLLAKWMLREKELKITEKNDLTLVGCVLLLGLILRLIIGAAVPGYDVDIGCFRGWAEEMAEVGPKAFYDSVGFCDYPPGYLWILWLLGGLGKALGTGVTELMVKLPPILCDMALCALLYAEGRKRLSEKQALALTVLYAFNPLVLVTGAAWGQADSVMLLLLILTVLFALRNRWAAALPLFMAAVLVKPQALMFGPLGLAALIYSLIDMPKEEKPARIKDLLLGLGLLAAAALLIAGPFMLGKERPVSWIIDLYRNTMSQYGYVTVNACNLYFLLGKNWQDAQSSLAGEGIVALISYLTAVAPLAAYAVMHWREESKNRVIRLAVLGGLSAALGLALILLALLGQLNYALLGTAMIVYVVALFLALYILCQGEKNLPLLGAGLLLVLFNTGTMMHERYLFPAVALLLLAYIRQKDKRILFLAVGVSIAGLLNVGCALDRNIRIGGAEGHLNAPAVGLQSDMSALEYLSALSNVLLGVCVLYLCLTLSRAGAAIRAYQAVPAQASRAAEKQPAAARRLPPIQNAPLRKMTGRDWAVMLIVTVLYAVLAFTNLGSTTSPQTAWVSKFSNEAVIFDLGEVKSFRMVFLPGIHWLMDEETAEFDVQVSEDGERWTGAYEGSVRSGETYDCFHWKYVYNADAYYGDAGAILDGRYVRLSSRFFDLTLYEVMMLDAESGEALPIVSVRDTAVLRDEATQQILGEDPQAQSGRNATLAYLTDEQDALQGEPGSFYNSTYFDEIYHARTAYEHLHGLPVYENTHPPLGKVLMSFAIAVFGMTPFGWRFAGALTGVLMLPGMYLLGKLLIRKKWGGFAAMMLMALDLMHYTQTRIATIDSFAVLFIIWAVYFMLRWFLLDFFRTDFKKTLVPLGLSGLFMGLAVASKWTGCYAGVGLAILFFFGLWRRWREVQSARKIPVKKRTAEENRAADGLRPLLVTVLSCFVFFVAVPLLIYYASYIPYFAPSGGVTGQKIISAAEGMLDYHSTPGLGMNHSFYSPWYEWPVIAKPMWYYSGDSVPQGMGSTIMSLGNPAVWWTGLAGLLGVIYLFARRHYDEQRHALSLYAPQDDPRCALLIICFFAQYLPWMLVPRGTYIYHYFPCVPFIILSTELCLDTLSEKHEKLVRILLTVLLAAAAILFVAFFPYASGVTVSTRWLEAVRWFPGWLWY